MNHKLSFSSIDTLFYKCINYPKLFYMYIYIYIMDSPGERPTVIISNIPGEEEGPLEIYGTRMTEDEYNAFMVEVQPLLLRKNILEDRKKGLTIIINNFKKNITTNENNINEINRLKDKYMVEATENYHKALNILKDNHEKKKTTEDHFNNKKIEYLALFKNQQRQIIDYYSNHVEPLQQDNNSLKKKIWMTKQQIRLLDDELRSIELNIRRTAEGTRISDTDEPITYSSSPISNINGGSLKYKINKSRTKKRRKNTRKKRKNTKRKNTKRKNKSK